VGCTHLALGALPSALPQDNLSLSPSTSSSSERERDKFIDNQIECPIIHLPAFTLYFDSWRQRVRLMQHEPLLLGISGVDLDAKGAHPAADRALFVASHDAGSARRAHAHVPARNKDG